MTTRSTDIKAAAERTIDLTDFDFALPLRVGVTPSGRVLLYADDGDEGHVTEVSIYLEGTHIQQAWASLIAQSVNLIGPLLAAGWREAALRKWLDTMSRAKATIEQENYLAEYKTPEVRT